MKNGNILRNDRIEKISYKDFIYTDIDINIVEIPKYIGKGYVKKIMLPNKILFSNWKMKYNMNILADGKEQFDGFHIMMCLKEGVFWKSEDGYKKIKKGETIIYKMKGLNECIYYNKTIQYEFASVKIPTEYFETIINYYFNDVEKNIIMSNIEKKSVRIITPTLFNSLKKIINISQIDGVNKLLAESRILEFIAIFFKEYLCKEYSSNKEISDISYERIKEVKRIIDNNIIVSPSLEELAKSVNMCVSKLTKIFKDVYGIPIHGYIIDRKLILASEMIKENKSTISEIGWYLGYSNMSHFSSSFKKKFGVTPTVYRKNNI